MSEKISPKPVKERDNIDLLELVCQLHSRSVMQTHNQDMHDAYIEARTELESRLTKSPVPDKVDAKQWLEKEGYPLLMTMTREQLEDILNHWQAQQSDAVEETNELALEAMDFYWRALTDKLNGKDLGDIERKNYEVLTAKLYKLLK